MSEEPITPPAFEEYPCSLGTVINHDAGSYIIRSPDGRIIGILANGELSAAAVESDIASPYAPPAPVPLEVSPWQIRRALNASGLRAVVEGAVANAGQDAKDGWEFASVIRRDNPLLAGMAAALGMTPAQVDDLFRLAASYQ